MIGVITNSEEHSAVCEFFELFKTPWEHYRTERCYDVALCSTDHNTDLINAKIVLQYGSRRTTGGCEDRAWDSPDFSHARILLHKDFRIPIYSGITTFPQSDPILIDKSTRQTAAYYCSREDHRIVIRIGYDLFSEIGRLLTIGQPSCNASIPTLDLHIRLLRELIVGNGVTLVEIPPIPVGYRFIVCLTHDVDHPSIRRHKFDHTMFGFLYRAVVGSVLNVIRRRASFGDMLRNWAAALKLPLVYLGLASDFWLDFNRYIRLENGLPSAFFVIPFSGQAGRTAAGPAPQHRASAYGAADISEEIRQLKTAGCEIGLHGLDAWIDSSRGVEELAQVQAISGADAIGARMHWLYFNESSPVELEKAGVNYDSTVGYNNEVGYRAGTTQVYKPLQVEHLLELPLHVMDTALFYPEHLHLTSSAAGKRIRRLIDHAADVGGCLTVNWHDRSIAPERLWEQPYLDLIHEARSRGAWFATASQAVAWFRKRRTATFEADSSTSEGMRIKHSNCAGDNLPGLGLRTHNPPRCHDSQRILHRIVQTC